MQNMKTVILFLTLAAATAAEPITDLGTVSERRGIILEKCKRRTDFNSFTIDFFPKSWPTNRVSITTTNELLTLADLGRLPSGQIIMAVKQTCDDGAESPLAYFTFEILRSNPSPVRAHGVAILTPEPSQSAAEGLRAIRQNAASEAESNAPPIPGVIQFEPPRSALPGGTNKTYGEHLDDMSAHFAKTGRRSE